jgi:hypothetical protein
MTRELRVLNKTHDFTPPDAVYIGRPSKWGNPFSHLQNSLAQFRTETREEAIAKYKEWILEKPELIEAAKQELRGRDLVCWCSPKPCHGEVLLEIANS